MPRPYSGNGPDAMSGAVCDGGCGRCLEGLAIGVTRMLREEPWPPEIEHWFCEDCLDQLDGDALAQRVLLN